MFDTLIGNPRVKQYLSRLIEKKQIPHAFLFTGPPGVGKTTFAKAFAAQLLGKEGHHPDLHIYSPEGKIGLHTIDTLRSITEDVGMAPFQADWKIFIIDDAHRMQTYSANALLKTFEEPSPQTVIILISDTPEQLLPTILSRCQIVPFQPIPQAELAQWISHHSPDKDPTQLARDSKGSIATAVRLLQEGEHPLKEILLPILIKGKFDTYSELAQAAQTLTEQVEAGKEEESEQDDSQLTAIQKQSAEKAQAGQYAMHFLQQTDILFEHIIAWYRDLYLIRYNSDKNFLYYNDLQHELIQAFQKGQSIELDLVLKASKEATTSLQRSTPLKNVLETFFLRLNLL